MTLLRHAVFRILMAALAVTVVLAVSGILVVRSLWFQEKVRARIVAEVEDATGGTAVIGGFRFHWRQLRAEVEDFSLRGTEPADQPPLFHADSIVVGLEIVSAFERDIDIDILQVHRPVLTIDVNEDGETNLPEPRAAAKSTGDAIAPVVDLAIRRIHVTDGEWRYGGRSGQFAFQGDHLDARAVYDPSVPGYQARLALKRLELGQGGKATVAMETNLALTVSEERIGIDRAVFTSDASNLNVTGTIERGGAQSGRFTIGGQVGMADLTGPLGLPFAPQGSIGLRGAVQFASQTDYSLEAAVTAEDLCMELGRVRADGLNGSSSLRADSSGIRLDSLEIGAWDGLFRGDAVIDGQRRLRAEGRLNHFSITQIMNGVRISDFVWTGSASGPVEVRGAFRNGGLEDLTVTSRLDIVPLPSQRPMEGQIDVSYDEASEKVEFGASKIVLSSTAVDFSGVLNEGIRLSVFSQDLQDFLPVATLLGYDAPVELPVELRKGVAQFAGLISGDIAEPRIGGHLSVGPLAFRDRVVDLIDSDFDVSHDRLHLRSMTLRQGESRAHGAGEITLEGWRTTRESRLAGEFDVEQAELDQLIANTGKKIPIAGKLAGTATISGTLGDPILLSKVEASGLRLWDEPFDRGEVTFRYSPGWLRIERGRLFASAGEFQLQGAYRHETDDWKNGNLNFDVSAAGFRLGQWRSVQGLNVELDAALEAKFSGALEFADATPRLASLDGNVAVNGLVIKGRKLGDAALEAVTGRNVLSVRARSKLRESDLRALAEWQLTGASAGLGQIEFRNLTLSVLQEVGLFGGPETDLFFQGSMDGEIGFSGPVLEPAKWRGMAKVTRLEMTPAPGEKEGDRDLTLRNEGSLLFAIDPAKITIANAHIVSPDTDLTATGTLSYLKKNPWNLTLRGAADLAVLTAFRGDLMAEGKSTVDASIRGSLLEPQVSGHLAFEDGSFYLRNLPNGIEQVNGRIIFNRTRATIEHFTSRTGGGDLRLSGFIGFGGPDWVYRLRALAKGVRIRYPADASTVFDADLDLTGSSTRSLLSGEITVNRAAFNPSTDLGSILSEAAVSRPVAEISNPFLRGMQFDVQVNTSGHARFLTSLTRDIEVEADLRVRGTPVRPVLLGRLSIHRGEIQFFGNKYDITQGEITFFNPVKIEPVLAMDLETRVRGYTVMINFSGPLDKLSFSYRSDPPLQSREILALLTVGRTPEYGTTSSTNTTANQSFLSAGGRGLLGQALAAPVSSRLQRFFGVSRIKIDPQLTGVDNTPETHVTIEQQISRDITLTYVTNLSRTQQQIVRLEWNFHPFWSVYAVRDSNGVFGIDFMYRRRFR